MGARSAAPTRRRALFVRCDLLSHFRTDSSQLADRTNGEATACARRYRRKKRKVLNGGAIFGRWQKNGDEMQWGGSRAGAFVFDALPDTVGWATATAAVCRLVDSAADRNLQSPRQSVTPTAAPVDDLTTVPCFIASNALFTNSSLAALDGVHAYIQSTGPPLTEPFMVGA